MEPPQWVVGWLLVPCEGEKCIFESRACDLEVAEGLIAQEHLPDDRFGFGCCYNHGAFVELYVRDAGKCLQEFLGEAGLAADGAAAAALLDLCRSACADDAAFVDDDDAVGERVGL